MKQWKWIALVTLLFSLLCFAGQADNQYYSVDAPIEISSDAPVVLRLNASEGWMWNISDNMDVTSWLVTKTGSPAFDDAAGIASAKLIYGPVADEENDVAIAAEITIDPAKISGFTVNGSTDLFVRPTGKSTLWACGNNHGQYQDSTEPAGSIVLPTVFVDGKLTANAGQQFEVTNGTVQIVLDLEGIDDSKIDASNVQISLLPGDGYKTYEVNFEEGTLADTWTGGKADYTMGNITGNFSPQGGDGNGHYDFRISVDGIRYNGLPLSEAIVRTDFYSFGRTFLTEGGSLILNSEPVWTSDVEIPVICDVYPDTLTATWPIAFDASAVTAADVTLTLISTYGDTLTLEPGTDYIVTASPSETEITLNYIYWAYAPVYTTLHAEISTANVTWNELMYNPTETFSHDYAIGSVYVYSVMSGGPSGTQAWTFFGLDNLNEASQVYMDATYTLTATDADGNTFFYGEDKDGKGIRVAEEIDAVAFNCNEECNVHLEGDTVYYSRLFDQTVEKEVDGETILFTKNYVNCETLLRPVDSLIDVTLAPGYAFGAGWEDHLKWPWQTFVDVGFKGGSK